MQRSRVTCRAAAVSVLGLLWLVTAAFTCPEICYCDYDGMVLTKCPGQGLKNVPTNLPVDTSFLILSFNKIQNLSDADFVNLTSLKYLDLSHNHIVHLQEGVFLHLNSLVTLDLNWNKISSLPTGVFSDLTSLEDLLLSNTFISNLPSGVFSNLTSLLELRLNNNNILSLPIGVFSDLNRLQRLRLDGSHIANLSDGVFSNLTSLEILNLSSNYISNLPSEVFSNLTSLLELYLDNNNISSLPTAVFSHLTSLTGLGLSDNHIADQPGEVFSNLNSLVWVHLSNNNISSLPTGLLSHLNRLQTFESLYIAGNPWRCDCSLNGLMTSARLLALISDDPTCSSPPHVKGGALSYFVANAVCHDSGYCPTGSADGTCACKVGWTGPYCDKVSTEQSPTSTQAIMIGGTSAGIATALIVAAVFFMVFLRRKRRERRENSPQSVKLDFIPDDIAIHRRKMEEIVPLVPPRTQFPKFEIDPSRVTLGQRIGSGAFGLVYRATLTRDDRTEDVVIKTVKDSASENDRLCFLEEIRAVVDLGFHENLLGLVNCCTVVRDHLYLITEFMPYGDLKSFLKKCRQEENPYGLQDDIYNFELMQMYQVARQIARGMDHIAWSRYVHGDLAARNVLVGERLKVKISDFGLAEDIYSRGYRRQDRLQKIPWKWMAPERLESGEAYTAQSDVWSFGIVLYEICTLGGDPYPDVATSNLKDRLQAGFRMPQPNDCPHVMYDLMLQCWRLKPDERPSFSSLEAQIDKNLAFYGPEYASTA